ncbi:TMEM165/GDT1 family protein [Nocardioides cavernaquae]|uniref:GDT1 family protein n=1 Tax=Nocardioides cavernaquae TaxID=2321396 RepID=A0A3A5H5P7_9ACTN|nr:TMEM165/GDT1 family protein [Nocardioides cavernaquae]RJS45872.1 TMEM165/GDT1 family protein [Nocardioides cavernaquae]
MDLLVVALTFGTVFLVELPDKTFIATLVLSTRFRPLLVWLGVGIAFALQTAIAVGLGQAVSLLPVTWVRIGAAVLFLVGAFLLLREARNADSEEAATEAEFAARADKAAGSGQAGRRSALTAVLTSFLVLFAAEWGDLSQLLILSLAAKYDEPLSVFAGALAGLLAVSGLAVLLGRWLLARIQLATLHYIGGGMCLLLAGLTLAELLT